MTAPNHGTPPRVFDTSFLLLTTGLGDAVVIWSLADGLLSVEISMLLHLALVGQAGLVSWALTWRLGESQALALLLMLLVGPPGAVAGIWFVSRHNEPASSISPELKDWYDTLIGEGGEFEPNQADDDFVDAVGLLNLDAPSIRDVLEVGNLADKRKALARIASAYHSDYYPLLSLALTDAEPTIRVQAAAIITGLSQEEREALDQTISRAEAADGSDSQALARQLGSHLSSNLLDTNSARNAIRALTRLVDLACWSRDAELVADLRLQLVWNCHNLPRGASRNRQTLMDLLDRLAEVGDMSMAS